MVLGLSDKTPIQNSFKPDYFRGETNDFSIEIYFVGTGSVTQDEIFPTNGVYRLRSSFAFTPITIKVNLTGYTSWNLGNITLNISGTLLETDFGNQTKTLGQIFAFVDNAITLVRGVELSAFGITVMVPQGDHTISLLYIGKDEEKGILYDNTDFTLRIQKPDTEFDEYITRGVPIDLDITDQYQDGIISGTAMVWSTESPNTQARENIPDKRIFFEPSITSSYYFDNGTSKLISNQMDLLFLNETNDEISIKGTFNTTGFDGLQPLQTWNKTKGISFFMDAAGLHELGKQTIGKATIRQGNNYLGIITIAPYGIMHKNIPCPLDSPCTGVFASPIDWEYSINSVSAINATGQVIVEMDSSFDFLASSQGAYFKASIGEQIIITETRAEETEGFLILYTISALLTIKILINRLDKKLKIISRRFDR